ncbi:MAG: mechanosensitive ion channel domain-containing protein [Pseudomonadota bacterium]
MTLRTPASSAETDPEAQDTAAIDGEGESASEGTSEGAIEEPPELEPEVEAEPEAPVEVVEGSNELIEGADATSETAGALLRTLHEWAFEIGNIRFSVLDALLIVAVILLVVTAAWFATRASRAAIHNLTRLDGSQKVLAEKVSTIAIWALAFFIGIDLLGVDLTALAFFGGAFGLAIGFGLQKTFGNLISGIILLLDKSIKPGDVISVTDQAGNESVGQIRKIGIRAISVITRDQTEHLIPNENLMINQVVNWSYSSKDVRVKAPVGVAYDSDLELVTRLLYQAADETSRVLKTPKPRVNIMEFGDNSVNFELRFWIQDPEGGLANIRSDVYMRIWQLFQENEVEIPFPQSDLHLRSSKQLDQLISVLAKNRTESE